MSDDLVKRLRYLGDHASFEPHMHHTAADRIEELEVECNKAALWAREQHASADRYAARIEELEAKLAKAVEALKDMCLEFRQADLPYGSAAYAKATATLAEIKGESHE